jgi:hypothetical protein
MPPMIAAFAPRARPVTTAAVPAAANAWIPATEMTAVAPAAGVAPGMIEPSTATFLPTNLARSLPLS